MRDAAVTHVLKARTFRDIMLISPLVFFLNKLANRCAVHAVFTIVLEFITQLESNFEGAEALASLSRRWCAP